MPGGWPAATWPNGQTPTASALGAADVKAIRAAVWAALDGRRLLREELAEEIVKRVGPGPRERLRSGFAFFQSEVCQGPPQGTRVTFVRPDQWIEGWREVDEQEALRDVCRRYVRTYGPARPSDFREWFATQGFKPADARALFDSLEEGLEEVDVDGHHAFVLAGDTGFAEPQSSYCRNTTCTSWASASVSILFRRG